MKPMTAVREWHNADRTLFENEIKPLAQPAVLKGICRDWPLVEASEKSSETLLRELQADYKGGDARFLSQSPEQDGYYFYNEAYTGFNFERKIAHLNTVFDLIRARLSSPLADRIAMQSAPVDDYFHTLAQRNQLTLLPEQIRPRFWLGTESKVNTHFDDADNIACVVSGKRVFTLFAPEQIQNLYPGSLENTPGGAAVSLAKLDNPDFVRFPKLRNALQQGLQAKLEPGDAIYIPALWWHHVWAESELNMLVNYWQGGSICGLKHMSGLDSVLTGLISIALLPDQQRQAWMSFFQYLVGSSRSEFDYIPSGLEGLLTGANKKSEIDVLNWLQRVVENRKNEM